MQLPQLRIHWGSKFHTLYKGIINTQAVYLQELQTIESLPKELLSLVSFIHFKVRIMLNINTF